MHPMTWPCKGWPNTLRILQQFEMGSCGNYSNFKRESDDPLGHTSLSSLDFAVDFTEQASPMTGVSVKQNLFRS